MIKLTKIRVTVLRELAWLSDLGTSPERNYGYWQPYHLRHFRGAGTRDNAPSFCYEAGVSIESIQGYLRDLHAMGLASRETRPVRYRINDAGREALAEWDRGHPS